MLKLKNKKSIAVFILMLSMASTSMAFAGSFSNDQNFNYKLPHLGHNGTAASDYKSTSKNYGRVKINDLSHASNINCWFRTKDASGNWNYDLSEMKNFEDGDRQTLYYDSAYDKGTYAELRMENPAETQFVKGKAQGTVWFN